MWLGGVAYGFRRRRIAASTRLRVRPLPAFDSCVQGSFAIPDFPGRALSLLALHTALLSSDIPVAFVFIIHGPCSPMGPHRSEVKSIDRKVNSPTLRYPINRLLCRRASSAAPRLPMLGVLGWCYQLSARRAGAIPQTSFREKSGRHYASHAGRPDQWSTEPGPSLQFGRTSMRLLFPPHLTHFPAI